MGLKATVAKGVKTAFNIVDDLQTEITILDETASVYDPTDGTVTQTTRTATVRGLLVNVRDMDRWKGSDSHPQEWPGSPEGAERKVLIDADLLDWTPSINSQVTWTGSVTYYTTRVDEDPSNSLYTLFIKAG